MFKTNRIRVFSVMLLCASAVALADVQTKMVDGYRELTWEDLSPPGWEPPEFIPPPEPDGPLPGAVASLDDPFKGALESLDDEAPLVRTLDKQKIRIPGYIIPIKYDDETVSEFLLVPYVGACIHVPPPPSNQMVYVRLSKPIASVDLWDPVWVNGTIRTESTKTEYAPAGYTMHGDKVTKYQEWQ